MRHSAVSMDSAGDMSQDVDDATNLLRFWVSVGAAHS